MKYLSVVLGTSAVFMLGIVGFIHSRRNTALQLTKSSYFESVKQRVTSDLLKELQSNIVEATTRLDQNRKKVEDLTTQLKTAQEVEDKKQTELNTCNEDLVHITTEIGVLETEATQNENEFHQNKANLQEQKNKLNVEAENRSKVCDYIIKTSVEAMKLCGIVPVLQAAGNPAA